MMILRDYQRASIDAVWAYLANRDGNPAVVIPTGGGKSPTMAGLIQEALTRWPGTRVCVLAHVRELVKQNAQKMLSIWPEAPIGIYSASLGRRDTLQPIMFASIQSVYNRAGELGRFDLVLVDEAHRIPVKGEGMYRLFLAACQRFNPDLRVIGFTATPYRLGVGPVCDAGNLLNEICYEVHLKELIDQGYLSRLISKASVKTQIDVSGVHVRQGEYVAAELNALVNRDSVIDAACREMVDLLADRRGWIVFCAGVEHAEAVNAKLCALGVASTVVEGSLSAYERDARLGGFQRGDYRAICNVNVLTEGFDATHVDAVVMLRPTKSPGLYVQMVGRGLRLHPGKENCLVLDFAQNILEHGPVDAIKVRKATKRGASDTLDKQPMKPCPECREAVIIQATKCPGCGYEWPFVERAPHQDQASVAPILSDEAADPVLTHAVDGVTYKLHAKAGSPLMILLVLYRCGLRHFREWVCIEHSGYARQRAVSWWRNRSLLAPDVIDIQHCPQTAERAVELAPLLPTPARIRVREARKYPEIIAHEFDARPDALPQVSSYRAPEGRIDGVAGAANANTLHGVRQLPGGALPQVGRGSAAGASWPWLR